MVCLSSFFGAKKQQQNYMTVENNYQTVAHDINFVCTGIELRALMYPFIVTQLGSISNQYLQLN